MKKRVGLLGLMAVMAVGLFQPAVASAQERGDYRRGYDHREYRDRDWRGDNRWREHEWREARERREWREHEWRERYARPYGYDYRYAPPAVQFGWYGR